MTTYSFGEIDIPIITSKDTSVSKNVTEKNFVDELPRVYELTEDLESGTYSIVLNKELHPADSPLKVQRDSVISMPEYHPAELPFDDGNDSGFVLVESASTDITSSQEIDRGELSIRFMEESEYTPAVRTQAVPASDDFSISSSTAQGIFGVPTSVSLNGTPTSLGTITSPNADIDLYSYDSSLNNWQYSSSNYVATTKQSAVTTISTGLVAEKMFSSAFSKKEPFLHQNGLMRSRISSDYLLDYYDGSSWNSGIASVNFDSQSNRGFVENPGSRTQSLNIPKSNLKVSSWKGLPAQKLTFSGKSSVTLDVLNGINSSNLYSYYVAWNDGTFDYVFVRYSDSGYFSVSSANDIVEWKGLDSSKEYEFVFGKVPSTQELSSQKYASRLFSIGKQEPTLI
jgi:hypothetical protein